MWVSKARLARRQGTTARETWGDKEPCHLHAPAHVFLRSRTFLMKLFFQAIVILVEGIFLMCCSLKNRMGWPQFVKMRTVHL